MHVSTGRKKVLFLEFNEITWSILDGLIAEGKTPNFERIKREGAWAEGLLPRASADELDRLVGVAMAVIQEEAKGR